MKWRSIFSLLLLLTLSGCVTGPRPPAVGSVALDPFAALMKNMSAAQVRTLIGEPAEIKPFVVEEFTCETWVYRRKISESVRQVMMGTRDVPVADLMTGGIRNVPEPFYEKQISSVIETIELLIFYQQLIEWKRHQAIERTIE